MTSAARSWRWTAAAFVTTALVLFPFYWMVTTALRKESSVFAYPPNLLPTDLSPGLLLAVLWMASPAAAAWPRSHGSTGEDSSCACCHSEAAIVGGLGCGGCQAAPMHVAGLTSTRIGAVVSWLLCPAAAVVGIDLAPADPPPRSFSV